MNLLTFIVVALLVVLLWPVIKAYALILLVVFAVWFLFFRGGNRRL